MNIGKIKLEQVQIVKMNNIFKIKGRLTLKNFRTPLKIRTKKLGHFGFDPLPPD